LSYMQRAGVTVSGIAYDGKVSREVASILPDCEERALRSLSRVYGSADDMVAAMKEQVIASLPLCESPIEEMMLVALGFMVIQGHEGFPVIHDLSSGEPWPNKNIVIVPQFAFARYRLDFLVTVGKRWLAVECDGADYHALPAQRIRDRNRDDYLRDLGIPTIRYSGAWLKRNGAKIADEVAAVIREWRAAA
jgi:hypothetical protein